MNLVGAGSAVHENNRIVILYNLCQCLLLQIIPQFLAQNLSRGKYAALDSS